MPYDRKNSNDRAVPSGLPRGFQGEQQMDGNVTTQFTPPTKGKGLQAREAVPSRSTDSGLERALGALADKTHKR